MFVDKAALVTLACCVLHNYCEIHRQRVLVPTDERLQRDPHVGFHVGQMQLPREGLPAKLAGEAMREVLFSSWLERNPQLLFVVFHRIFYVLASLLLLYKYVV